MSYDLEILYVFFCQHEIKWFNSIQFNSCFVKALAETSISAYWLIEEINQAEVCWYLVNRQTCASSYLTLNTNLSACKLIIDLKCIKKQYTVVLFISVFNERIYDVFAPWKKKRIMNDLYFFKFFFLRFKYYGFCLQWIKTKTYSVWKKWSH